MESWSTLSTHKVVDFLNSERKINNSRMYLGAIFIRFHFDVSYRGDSFDNGGSLYSNDF